jgi:hypothetical protein
MGQDLDENISAWDEMFLPVEIARNIAGFSYTAADGAEHRLLKSVEMRSTSKTRQPILNTPLKSWPACFLLGFMIAAILLFIKRLRGKHRRIGKILLGLSQSAAGLFLGGAGVVLVFGLFFMNNDYIQQNINILFVNPLLLAACPLGIMEAVSGSNNKKREKVLNILWAYVFIEGSITVLAGALPVFFQQNQPVQAAVLPAAFVFANFKMPKIPKSCSSVLF